MCHPPPSPPAALVLLSSPFAPPPNPQTRSDMRCPARSPSFPTHGALSCFPRCLRSLYKHFCSTRTHLQTTWARSAADREGAVVAPLDTRLPMRTDTSRRLYRAGRPPSFSPPPPAPTTAPSSQFLTGRHAHHTIYTQQQPASHTHKNRPMFRASLNPLWMMAVLGLVCGLSLASPKSLSTNTRGKREHKYEGEEGGGGRRLGGGRMQVDVCACYCPPCSGLVPVCVCLCYSVFPSSFCSVLLSPTDSQCDTHNNSCTPSWRSARLPLSKASSRSAVRAVVPASPFVSGYVNGMVGDSCTDLAGTPRCHVQNLT